MSDEDDWAGLRINDTPGGLHVGSQRRQRFLHGSHVVTIALKDGDDWCPGAAIYEGAVDQYD
jgi:hypothetical protein